MEDKNDFGLPESIIKAFTCGDCWALAIELSKRMDLNLVTAQADDYWTHVGVLLPNGNVLDIQGVSTMDDWLETWLGGEEGEEHYAEEWDPESFEGEYFRNPYYPQHPAKIWAERVLAAYTPMV